MQKLTKWLKLFLLFASTSNFVQAQDTGLDLDSVTAISIRNYPLVQQKQLVAKTAALTVENLSKGFLPQINLGAQATYQSAVTGLNISLPGMTIDPMSKDQYKVQAEISQLIYDAGAIKAQQQVQQLQAKVEDGKLEVELYKLKERVTQIFVSILYLDAQAAQLNLVEADLNIGLKKLTAQVEQGVAYRSNLNTIKAELLKLQQRKIELAASRTGLVDVLGIFMHQSLPASQPFKKPVLIEKAISQVQRPELTLFAQQSKLALQQLQMIQAKNMPKAALFVQGGYGRPGLNMLKNSFEWFGMGGVKLSWSLGGWYTAPREKKIVQMQSDAIQIQQATFLLQTATQQQQQLAEIQKLRQLIGTDREIIALRESIRTAAEAQLQNGVITANDYLRDVNAADQARQTMLTHDIQLLQAQLNLQLINGK